MTYNPDIHHRRSIRLKEYDYSRSGAYFVTVCAWKKECLFGEIRDGEMVLNDCGRVVQEQWNALSLHFNNVETDEFVVMPNHMHGIVVINNCSGEVSSPDFLPDSEQRIQGGEIPPLRVKRTLGQIVAYFKYQSTKQIDIIRNSPGIPVWQRNYYEHVIRILCCR